MYFLDILILIGWYELSYKAMQEVQWPKELVKDVVPMHDKERK